ncbi:ABC transporter permease [Rhodococcoides kyotonense]|uniref:NitT/TauT family transport system permease protein n=1 Tax=Rhodococcoides kyotonense TaxID=398843 RepID=A0A239LA24_9NOCA|nr:ABC transporter permease [Rhodococcus kyotonensis]SNT27135.1 NitT/TauT family transport system permease protein [Rhodococcus kyotonensis]
MTSTRSVVPGYLRPPPSTVVRMRAPGWTAAIILVALLVIEVYARSPLASPLDIVPVSDMAVTMVELLGDPEFLADALGRTLGIIVVAFVLSSVLGVAAAYMLWRFELWDRAFQPYLNVYYAVPTFALYPIMVVLFGSGIAPIAVLSTIFAFGVVALNARTGFNSVSPIVTKLGTTLEMTRWQFFRSILLPYALPNIVTGLKLGLSYAIISVLASEFILSTQGLGHFISIAYDSFDIDEMYAGILVVTALALLATLGISAVLNRFDWRRRR